MNDIHIPKTDFLETFRCFMNNLRILGYSLLYVGRFVVKVHDMKHAAPFSVIMGNNKGNDDFCMDSYR